MFVHYRTPGIVLKKEDRGEADQFLTILTKDFGKIKVLAKSIRKIKSKLKSGVSLFSLSEIGFIQGKRYKILTDAVSKNKFSNINDSLEKLRIATEIGEDVDSLVRGEEKEEEIWDLVLGVFEKLNNSFVSDSLVYYYFFWNLITILGYQPELNNCSFCQRKLVPENLYFNPDQGGVICNNCFRELKSGRKIDPETIKLLRFLIREDWEGLKKINIDQSYERKLEDISNVYLSYFKDILNPS